jgi:SAM-dependent methyltransferase
MKILERECGLSPAWEVADIGSGTGFLTELFLRNGNRTFGIEPNAPMREAAEAYLAGFTNFVSVDATAEETGLPDSSIDLVAAGQAFHWFDAEKCKVEFGRILKPGGWTTLIWNQRSEGGSPFMREYERIVAKYSTDYKEVYHRRIDESVLHEFFSPSDFATNICENTQQFDLQALIGRFLSSSYAPEPESPQYAPSVQALTDLFERHQVSRLVAFAYDTEIYSGRLTS